MQKTVAALLSDIERHGDRAVRRLLKRFDGLDAPPSAWRVPAGEPARALKRVSPENRSILEEAAQNVRRFHEAEKRHTPRSWRTKIAGRTLGQEVRPLDAVGLYVPGGRFAYPSTVLMTSIPARVAGVRRVVVVTPPRHLTDEVLAACALAGVDEIYKLGGVAAIGALAFGTETIRPVDLIAGPGGAWVTEAKRQVFGRVGIDMLAGPSEIVLLADASVPADFVAADMMAQAEHGPDSRSILISPDAEVLKAVRRAVAPEFLSRCEFRKVRDWTSAVAVANVAAPEHLSLAVKNPKALLPQIKNAGAIFMGPWTPVAAGDYWAGPSHVLPTGRSARFSSGLSVMTFLKHTSVIDVPQQQWPVSSERVARLATAEGLIRHADSLRARGAAAQRKNR